MSKTIDLNADLGELPGKAGRASDAAILEHVTSCAIACGGHAGDASTMAATLEAAAERGVQVGAHPSYPDRENFGRKSMTIAQDALHDALCDQMQALAKLAKTAGVALTHVKPHGALYNDATGSALLAETIIKATQSVFSTQIAIVGQPDSEAAKTTLRAGLSFHKEGFIDRTYMPDGSLMPRSLAGAVLNDSESRLAQARRIVMDGCVLDAAGNPLALDIDTLCLHGDSPGAAETARQLRAALEADGVILRAAGQG